jgi:hypothetical protein
MVDHALAPKHIITDFKIDQNQFKTTSNNQYSILKITHFKTEITLKMEPKVSANSINIDPRHP